MNRRKILIPIILFTALIIILIIVLMPSTERYSKISISTSKWDSIISARIENKNLVLEDIEFNNHNLIIDETNNTLYYSIVNDSSTKYNPSVSFSSSDKNAQIAVLLCEITDELIKENYEFKIMIYNDREYHIYSLKCTNFPILNIDYKEDVGDKQKNIPIDIYLFDNLTNLPNKIIRSTGRLKINEDNYTFALNMTSPGNNIRDNKISILNMKPNSEYMLTKVNTKEDNLEKNNEPTNHRIALFINNKYQGIYSINQITERKNKENI